jgi:hypothetical protein
LITLLNRFPFRSTNSTVIELPSGNTFQRSGRSHPTRQTKPIAGDVGIARSAALPAPVGQPVGIIRPFSELYVSIDHNPSAANPELLRPDGKLRPGEKLALSGHVLARQIEQAVAVVPPWSTEFIDGCIEQQFQLMFRLRIVAIRLPARRVSSGERDRSRSIAKLSGRSTGSIVVAVFVRIRSGFPRRQRATVLEGRHRAKDRDANLGWLSDCRIAIGSPLQSGSDGSDR